jgi:hypothetical protein
VVIRNAASNINDMRVPDQKLSKSTVHHNRNVNSMQSYGRYWNDVMSHENFEAELYKPAEGETGVKVEDIYNLDDSF